VHPIRQEERGQHTGCLVKIIVLGILLGMGLFVYNGLTTSTDENNTVGMVNPVINSPAATPTDNTPAMATNQFTSAPIRTIYFPGVDSAGEIVEVPRVPGGWDVENLQNKVGHLEGTAWLGDTGNTVLAGHFEDEIGRPGTFRYLYEAKVGDRILVQEGGNDFFYVFEVQEVFSTAPDDLEVLRNSQSPKLTLITCDSWSFESKRYEERLIVVAAPIGTYQGRPTTTNTTP
jgi:LPXTG-site transpeptidase (sortase) family protein